MDSSGHPRRAGQAVFAFGICVIVGVVVRLKLICKLVLLKKLLNIPAYFLVILFIGLIMDEILESIISEEASKLNIEPDEFRKLAERGCMIVFKDDLKTRINLFGGLSYPKENLRELLLACATAGAIKASIDSEEPGKSSKEIPFKSA